MARKSAITVNCEYAALRAFCALAGLVPYRFAIALADAIAFIAVRVLRFKRTRTLERLESVFPEKSRREHLFIAWRSLANILATGVEMMRASRFDRAWMDRHIVDGPKYREILGSLSAEGHGVVIMVPHAGNWYMAAWAMARYGLPLSAIAARQRNPKIEAWMRRQYGDIKVVERGTPRTLLEVIAMLRAGRCFAILPDLRAPHPDVEVDFLGHRANVSHAGAMFAVRCQSPIVVAMMRREGGRHTVNDCTVLRPDPQAPDPRREAVRLTREAFKVLDRAVRAHPEDWFWYNKRWILQPVKNQPSDKKGTR